MSLLLPSGPDIGESYIVKDISGQAGQFNVTVTSADSKNIDNATSYVIATNFQSVVFVYDGTQWVVY